MQSKWHMMGMGVEGQMTTEMIGGPIVIGMRGADDDRKGGNQK